jgi:hypothetical protein
MTWSFDETHCPRCGARLPAGRRWNAGPASDCPHCSGEATTYRRAIYFGTNGSLLRIKRQIEDTLGMHFTIRQHTDCFENGRLRSELSFGGRFLFAEVWLALNSAEEPSLTPYRFVLSLAAELEPRQVDALDHLAVTIARRLAPQHPERLPLIRPGTS